MKSIGIVTLISVLAVAAAPSTAPVRAQVFATTKSTAQFADCFTKFQDAQKSPWWFVPKEHGGTFSNAGAANVGKPYLLLISDRGGRREIQMQNAARNGPEAQAVSQCV